MAEAFQVLHTGTGAFTEFLDYVTGVSSKLMSFLRPDKEPQDKLQFWNQQTLNMLMHVNGCTCLMPLPPFVEELRSQQLEQMISHLVIAYEQPLGAGLDCCIHPVPDAKH